MPYSGLLFLAHLKKKKNKKYIDIFLDMYGLNSWAREHTEDLRL